MKYTSEVIKSAYNELDSRRESALALHASRVDDVRINYPEVYGVYSAILSTKDKLAEVILSKGGDVRANIEKIRDDNLSRQQELRALLKRFSLPEDYLEIKYTCSLCSDSGVFAGNRCKCVTALLDRFAVEKLNQQCRIKLNSFADFDLSHYPESFDYRGNKINAREKMAENLRFCMNYVRDFNDNSPGLFLYGATGLGKTMLSSCIAQGLLSKGYSVAFDSIQNYLRDIENEQFNRSEGDTMQTLLNADIVILDDLGSEFITPFSLSALYNIINTRLNSGKPTIISSNLSLEDLSKKYDDRIISRLTGMFYTLRFFGEDIRQIKRRKGVLA